MCFGSHALNASSLAVSGIFSSLSVSVCLFVCLSPSLCLSLPSVSCLSACLPRSPLPVSDLISHLFLSVHFNYLTVCLSVCLSPSVYLCLFLAPSLYLSVRPSVCLCQSFSPIVCYCLSVLNSITLSVFLCLFLRSIHLCFPFYFQDFHLLSTFL